MNHPNRRSFAVLILVTALAACAENADRITAPEAGSSDVRALDAKSPAVAERAALEEIGRLVAVSLSDKKLRHQLKKHLRSAPFKEHKLQLSAYLRGPDGKELLARLGARGTKADAILTLLDQVRPLELYMPDRKQRETWIGDAELLVAVQLEEDDAIVAFGPRGNRVSLDRARVPEQPTISIVPVETRFDQPMSASARNVNDMNGMAIGTLVLAGFKTSSFTCTTCISEDTEAGGSSGGGGGGVAPGLYLEFSRILDLHEPWTRGDPEIEAHIQGPGDPSDPRAGLDLSCSGEHARDHRKVFDQDDAFWTGRVMLFSADETARFNAQFGDGFHVIFWEDDDTACAVKVDHNPVMELLKATASFSAVALKLNPITLKLAVGALLVNFFSDPEAWILTNDDFVGVAVPKEQSGYDAPANTHVLMQGRTMNGRTNIVYHP